MHGRRARLVPFEGRNTRRQVPVAPAYRLLQPRRRLSRRRRERNPVGRGDPQVDEQGHDRGRDGGLAGARAARDHAEPAGDGVPGRRPGGIAGGDARKETVERGLESGGLQVRRRLRTVRKLSKTRRDRPLRRPETLQIEPAPAVEDERTALLVTGPRDDGARGQHLEPRFEIREPRRPGSRPVPARDLGQRDARVSVPGPCAGERRRERQRRPSAPVELRHERREVPVDVCEMPLREQVVRHRCLGDGPRVADSGAVPGPMAGRRGARRRRHAPLLRKQSSSASRHSAAGRSKCTPRPVPAAGSMPRTKR